MQIDPLTAKIEQTNRPTTFYTAVQAAWSRQWSPHMASEIKVSGVPYAIVGHSGFPRVRVYVRQASGASLPVEIGANPIGEDGYVHGRGWSSSDLAAKYLSRKLADWQKQNIA